MFSNRTIKMNVIFRSGKIWQDEIKYPSKAAKQEAVERIKAVENTIMQKLGDKESKATFKFGQTQMCICDISAISFLY